jgi:integrase
VTEIEPAPPPVLLRPAGPEPVAYTDLDYSITVETAENLIAAIPENTRLAYGRAWSQFEGWCTSMGRVALPATAQTLADYVTVLTVAALAPATVDQAIGAIRSVHREHGYRDQPDTRQPLRLLSGYRRTWAAEGGRVRRKSPLLLDGLRRMTGTCDPEKAAGARDRALLLLGYNMMARRSELAGLDIADLVEIPGEGLTVFLKFSKTDQAARGAYVPVPYGRHERTCAVRAVAAWTDVLAARGITGGALFRPVDRHGHVGGEPAVAGTPARARLTGKSVSLIVRRRAVLAGLKDPGTYSCHSLRAGAATTAYAAGVPVSAIAGHGRWAPTSPVVLGYIRAVDGWNDNPMKKVGL